MKDPYMVTRDEEISTSSAASIEQEASSSVKKGKSLEDAADRKQKSTGQLSTEPLLSYHPLHSLFSYLCNIEFTDPDTFL